MPELQRVRADHGPAILDFERANRGYFTAFIADRGEEYFEHFDERYDALLADQAAGNGAYHVLVDEDGTVWGRFNLIFEDGVATLGYRVAERAAGRGVATAAVRDLCALAAREYDVRTVRAATSTGNIASQRVLLKAGFRPVGPADPAHVGGKQGTWYRLDVVPEPDPEA